MRIRHLKHIDYPKIRKMISYLDTQDGYGFIKGVTGEPISILNEILPLRCKFLPESYIISEQKDILGLITVNANRGNPYKINITRLVFKQDFLNTGKQLIDFVVSKYGAKGANTFIAFVDECHDELASLFINECGFRQCSYENLWKLDNFVPEISSRADFKAFNNEDAIQVSELYNSELNNLYKPSMERSPKEYIEPIFMGLKHDYKNRYVLKHNEKVIAYLSITTCDNMNFILDISTCDGYMLNYDEILNFGLSEISRRKTKFTAFLKHRQYAKNADKLEEYLHSRNLNCVQTQCVLVKDFYRPVKETENLFKAFVLGENSIISD